MKTKRWTIDDCKRSKMNTRMNESTSWERQKSICKLRYLCLFVVALNYFQILRIRLYVMRDFENTNTFYETQRNYDTHENIRKYYDKSHLKKLIVLKIKNKRDRLIITS